MKINYLFFLFFHLSYQVHQQKGQKYFLSIFLLQSLIFPIFFPFYQAKPWFYLLKNGIIYVDNYMLVCFVNDMSATLWFPLLFHYGDLGIASIVGMLLDFFLLFFWHIKKREKDPKKWNMKKSIFNSQL